MSRWRNSREFGVLKGQTLISVTGDEGDDEMRIETVDADGNRHVYVLDHAQECCESVAIEDICGTFDDMIGQVIELAEEVSSYDAGDEVTAPPGWKPGDYTQCYTWTFYKIVTNRGFVTIRWLGESNGYYGESVDMWEVTA